MREEVKIRLLQNILREVTNKYDYFILHQEEILKETFEKAIRDPLTGLYNRSFLMERLQSLISKAKRKETKIKLVFLDLNNFKQVNDIFGHEEGDKVLKKVANIIKNSFREYDLVARYGGDEFIVVLEDNGDNVNLFKIMDRINKRIKDLFEKYKISLAWGYVSSDETLNIEELIALADGRMYQNKNKMKEKM